MHSLSEMMRKISAEPNDTARASAQPPVEIESAKADLPVSPENLPVDLSDDSLSQTDNVSGSTAASANKPEGLIKRLFRRFTAWVKRIVGF